MRVLGLAADGAFAVLETDGRTIEAFGPAGTGAPGALLADIDLIGLAAGDAQALASKTGLPVAFGLGASRAAYLRARVRGSGLERPTAVIDGDTIILVAENGLMTAIPAERLGEARAIARAEDFGRYVEAEATAYLAARCWNGFPIAFPGTTGAPYPMPLGQIARPPW